MGVGNLAVVVVVVIFAVVIVIAIDFFAMILDSVFLFMWTPSQ